MNEFGFVRVSTVTPRVTVANPVVNADEHLRLIGELSSSDVILFPELSISAYTCAKLFMQDRLIAEAAKQTWRVARCVTNQLVVVGVPLKTANALYNCSAVLHRGEIVGLVPKDFIPNYNEFYEGRWFSAGSQAEREEVSFGGVKVPFGTNLLFQHVDTPHDFDIGIYIEICEAIWMPIPNSSFAAIAGANVLLNPSASNETIGKPDSRRNLVLAQSASCIAAYAYASAGPTESTADIVMGGHCMIAEAGHLLVESRRVGDGRTPERGSYWITADVDVQNLNHERRVTTSFNESIMFLEGRVPYRGVPIEFDWHDPAEVGLRRSVSAQPFVPHDPATLDARSAEILGIQTCALAKRLESLGGSPKVVIGVSGGLDSTLALLVACETYDMLGLPREHIRGVTMPGFGTSEGTLANARTLMRQLGVSASEIDIRADCLSEFKALARVNGYRPFGRVDLGAAQFAAPLTEQQIARFEALLAEVPAGERDDLTFENVQARRRTEYLMNLGFVLGTGDMSELWLGWCTYNADHQSMYNVNCSVPKTLVKFLVRYVASRAESEALRETLLAIAATTVSPELLPRGADGRIEQSTEEKLGPYELHDFYMFHFVRNGFSPQKILFLSDHATGWGDGAPSRADREKWLAVNIRRAFGQQYKRENVPNGPKIGSVTLSPRSDWRMPPDADPQIWLASLDPSGG